MKLEIIHEKLKQYKKPILFSSSLLVQEQSSKVSVLLTLQFNVPTYVFLCLK